MVETFLKLVYRSHLKELLVPMMSLKALRNCPLDAVQIQMIKDVRISLFQYKIKQFECRK